MEAVAQKLLHEASPGSAWTIELLTEGGDDAIKRRLMVLGFVPGTRVEVLRRAPLGDPTEYALRGVRISLRRSEASLIKICEAMAEARAAEHGQQLEDEEDEHDD